MKRKSTKYRVWIKELPCCMCPQPAPSECAHVRLNGKGGTGFKPKDEGETVPLCDNCHRTGDNSEGQIGPKRFWAGKDPLALGAALVAVKYDTRAAIRKILEFRAT